MSRRRWVAGALAALAFGAALAVAAAEGPLGLLRVDRMQALAGVDAQRGLDGARAHSEVARARAKSGLAGAHAEPRLTDCRVAGLPRAVRCGAVQRPLDPAHPDGIRIDIHYAVVPALARRKLPDPVFLLAGGPGQSAISLAPAVMPFFARLHNRRDIVFVDQRGTGRSAPLDCDEADREPLSDASDPDRQLEQLARCRERLEALPHVGGAEGLRHYTTAVAMEDLDAVRSALKAERIDLVGASYGTRAALEYLRRFPTAVRRVVLDGAVPPDMVLPASHSTDAQAALDAVFAACRAEGACARLHPNLQADWEALLASLPRTVTLPDPRSGVPEPVRMTRQRVLGAVRGPLYVPALAAGLPAAIEAAAQGRFEGLAGLAALFTMRRDDARLAMGMHFAVVCAEDVPRLATATDPPGRDFGTELARFYQRACADWPRGQVPAGFYSMPQSAAPVLVLSGGLDPATPPRHGRRVVEALGPMARHAVVANAGHGLMGLGCLADVLYRFIDADDDRAALAVDAECAARVPRPPAFEPISAASAPEAR
jgi:pimeloyl-ACP methyl ester carboxylesterase